MASYTAAASGDVPRTRPASKLERSALAAAVALLLGGGAGAQEPVDEITVTGSRIVRTTTFQTPVPVTAVTPEELRAIQPGRTIADQLDQLPQFYLTQSAQRGGGALFGAAGISALNMRAMGPQRTLVLLDGARVSPADRDGSVHVDNLPTALLRQVEVVTGGASAAYGADALAGVTNFILNREYTGFDVSLGAGRTDAGFGNAHDVSIAYGTPIGERWHFIGSVENQQIDPIDPEPHELGGWFRRYGIVENPAWHAGDTSQPRRLVLPDVHSTVHTPTGKIQAVNAQGAPIPFSFNGYTFTYDGDGVREFREGDVVGIGNQSGGPETAIADDAFNGAVYAAEVKRRNVFAGVTFDADDRTRIFANLFAGETESNDYNQRGIPHLTSPWAGHLFVENPFLPANVRQAMMAEGIDRIRFEKQGTVLGQDGNWNDDETRHNQFSSWTLQLGVDRDVGRNWRMQARLQRGSTERFTAVWNEVRVDREYLAMDAVEVYPGTTTLVSEEDRGMGVIVCNVQRFNPTEEELRAAVEGYRVPAPQGDDSLGGPADLVPIPGPVGNDDSIRNCVPMNVLGQGNVSREAAAYVTSPKWGIGKVTQEFAEVLFTGPIWDGFGPGPFSMAVGGTWREQWFWQRGYPVELMAFGPPRNAEHIGIRGFPGGFEGGSANLHEFSTVPVIAGGYDVWEVFAELNMPLWASGPRRLEIDLAGRYSDYSTSGGIVSHKTGLNFQVAEPLRLRATASRDVREPTFAERFNLQGGGGNVRDPLNGGNVFEITVTTGGNPDLEPEEADTLTAGFVYQPTRVPGLQFSMDWFDIDLSGAVGTLGQQRIVDECVAGAADLCALIRREDGIITNVRNVQLNVDSARVRGLDYELVFSTEPNLFSTQSESFSVRLLAGRLLEESTTVSAGTTTDRAGHYSRPDFTALANVRYQVGPFGASWQQRYIPETTLDWNFVEGVDIDDNTVQSKTYTDLTLFYDAEVGGGRWRASLAVTNLFDTDPPVVANWGQRFSAQTAFLPTLNGYDLYGRRYNVAFRYNF